MQKQRRWMPLFRQVWVLSLPVIFTNLLQTLVSVIDTFMVGRLGPIQIAAAGMSNAIRLLVLVLVLSVAAGAMSLVAQAKGARDRQRMSFVTRQAITSGIMISIFMGAGGIALARPLLMLANSGGDPRAVELGTAYLNILFLGTPFLVLNIVFNRLMQGAGDTITPLILTGALNALNIFFNWVFMFGIGPVPAYGLSGAAIGTVIARGLGIVVAFWIIKSDRNVIKILPGTYWPNWRMIGDIFSIGVPSGIQGIFRNGARLLVIGIITSTELGTYGAAALAIGLQVESLAFMPVLGINVAATSLVGQSLGRWQVQEAWERGNVAHLFGVLVMAVLVSPIILFAPQILRLFDPSGQPILAAAGVTYLRLNTFFLPVAAISMIANGAMRGGGDSTPGMLSTMIFQGAVSTILAYLLAFPLEMGSMGVWIALVIGVVGNASFMGWRWLSGHWIEVALRKSELYRVHLVHWAPEMAERYLREVKAVQMARPGTIEQVESQRVVYQSAGHRVEVRFGSENRHRTTDYRILIQ